jgi:hypothetical protein
MVSGLEGSRSGGFSCDRRGFGWLCRTQALRLSAYVAIPER